MNIVLPWCQNGVGKIELQNHHALAGGMVLREYCLLKFNGCWDIGISTKTGEVWGHTSMDNFDMDMYLDKLEVRPSDIDWDVADHYDVTYWDKMED